MSLLEKMMRAEENPGKAALNREFRDQTSVRHFGLTLLPQRVGDFGMISALETLGAFDRRVGRSVNE